jgi:hypothetical protein
MVIFVRDGDRREDGDCHGRVTFKLAIEMVPGVLSAALCWP